MQLFFLGCFLLYKYLKTNNISKTIRQFCNLSPNFVVALIITERCTHRGCLYLTESIGGSICGSRQSGILPLCILQYSQHSLRLQRKTLLWVLLHSRLHWFHIWSCQIHLPGKLINYLLARPTMLRNYIIFIN